MSYERCLSPPDHESMALLRNAPASNIKKLPRTRLFNPRVHDGFNKIERSLTGDTVQVSRKFHTLTSASHTSFEWRVCSTEVHNGEDGDEADVDTQNNDNGFHVAPVHVFHQHRGSFSPQSNSGHAQYVCMESENRTPHSGWKLVFHAWSNSLSFRKRVTFTILRGPSAAEDDHVD